MSAPAYADAQTRLYCGDAHTVLADFADASADCVVTSPPYWRKRDYGVPGQYGLEETFQGYVQALRAVFAEVHRVLAPQGTLWLNLGDSHIAAAPGPRTNPGTLTGTPNSRTVPRGLGEKRGLAAKNLVGIPWRVAFALQEDGWLLRSAIVWHKPNAMPESVTDRPATRHEYLFLLVKQQHYFFDLDAIREPRHGHDQPSSPSATSTEDEAREEELSGLAHRGVAGKYTDAAAVLGGRDHGIQMRPTGSAHAAAHPQGRNPGDVWHIPTRPTRHGHYASFPIDIPLRAIAAGCPPGGSVLDPFCGSGTTLVAARHLGRVGIGIDIQPAYIELARSRLRTESTPMERGGGEA